MSQVTQRGTVAPSMNITPLIDVVFLLIIFFMIVSKIQSDQNAEMMVPQFDDAKTREVGDIDVAVVNVAPVSFSRADRERNPLAIDGNAAFVQIGANLRIADPRNAPAITAELQNLKSTRPELEVLLRADRALYYSSVQPVMGAITSAGIETVNLVAFKPEE